MSDIGLLMTNMLAMGQKISSNLPQQLLIQHENDLFQSTSAHLLSSTATLQVTPPEFTQFGETSSAAVFSPKYITKNILSIFLNRLVQKEIFNDSKSNKLKFASVNFVAEREIIADAGVSSVRTVVNRRRNTPNLATLQFGDSGITVRVLQKLLVASGYNIQVDGFFGALTEVAVKAFQSRQQLTVDGIVGRNTWTELTR
ncbi:MAG: peptidoglycan-binding protein [Calothrix sp. C42_A2020_038]|nr:peptidoglycan-binding protein [Calothrix sp. C42_A2020_038]